MNWELRAIWPPLPYNLALVLMTIFKVILNLSLHLLPGAGHDLSKLMKCRSGPNTFLLEVDAWIDHHIWTKDSKGQSIFYTQNMSMLSNSFCYIFDNMFILLRNLTICYMFGHHAFSGYRSMLSNSTINAPVSWKGMVSKHPSCLQVWMPIPVNNLGWRLQIINH